MLQSQISLTKTEINTYLDFLKLAPSPPDLNFLSQLQKQHIETIPWENFDLYQNKETSLNKESIFQKIFLEKRGGVCYELNTVYAALLQALQFNVYQTVATVYAIQRLVYPQPHASHLINIVFIDNVPYLSDVGWDGFRKPLPLNGEIVNSVNGEYRVCAKDSCYEMQIKIDNVWQYQYTFELKPMTSKQLQSLLNYADYPNWHPALQQLFYFKHTPHEAIKLTGNSLTITQNGKMVTQQDLNDIGGLAYVLEVYYGLSKEIANKLG